MNRRAERMQSDAGYRHSTDWRTEALGEIFIKLDDSLNSCQRPRKRREVASFATGLRNCRVESTSMLPSQKNRDHSAEKPSRDLFTKERKRLIERGSTFQHRQIEFFDTVHFAKKGRMYRRRRKRGT